MMDGDIRSISDEAQPARDEQCEMRAEEVLVARKLDSLVVATEVKWEPNLENVRQQHANRVRCLMLDA